MHGLLVAQTGVYTDAEIAIGQIVLIVGLVLWVGACLVYQIAEGVDEGAVFDDAPKRAGKLTPIDMLAGMCLWIGGSVMGAIVAKQFANQDDVLWSGLFASLGGGVGAWVMVGYVLFRAGEDVEGGLRGFGLRFDGAGLALWRGFKVWCFIVPATFLTLAVSSLFAEMLGEQPDQLAHETLKLISQSRDPWAWGVMLFTAVVLAPIVEEVLFRGLIQTVWLQLLGGMYAKVNRWWVILPTSLFFALVHAGGVPWYAFGALFVLGCGLGYAYEKTGRLWVPIGLHAGYNLLNAGLSYWMTGGQVGG